MCNWLRRKRIFARLCTKCQSGSNTFQTGLLLCGDLLSVRLSAFMYWGSHWLPSKSCFRSLGTFKSILTWLGLILKGKSNAGWTSPLKAIVFRTPMILSWAVAMEPQVKSSIKWIKYSRIVCSTVWWLICGKLSRENLTFNRETCTISFPISKSAISTTLLNLWIILCSKVRLQYPQT